MNARSSITVLDMAGSNGAVLSTLRTAADTPRDVVLLFGDGKKLFLRKENISPLLEAVEKCNDRLRLPESKFRFQNAISNNAAAMQAVAKAVNIPLCKNRETATRPTVRDMETALAVACRGLLAAANACGVKEGVMKSWLVKSRRKGGKWAADMAAAFRRAKDANPLTAKEILLIREAADRGESQASIGRRFERASSTVSNIVTGKTPLLSSRRRLRRQRSGAGNII